MLSTRSLAGLVQENTAYHPFPLKLFELLLLSQYPKTIIFAGFSNPDRV
jgi:hypothetical protein